MNKIAKSYINSINTFSIKLVVFTLVTVPFSMEAYAALPDPKNPSKKPGKGDYIGLLKGYFFDIFLVLGLVMGAVAFYVVAKNAITVYSEIGEGKKTWGALGAHAIAGVLLLVFVIFLLTDASDIVK